MNREPMKLSILVTIRITVRIQESEVRNPHSLDYWNSYQRILMKFYGELGCGLETNCLHFGVDPQIQSLYCQNPLLAISTMFPLLLTSITCKFQHVPFTANFHYLQIQPPLLPKSITCNFSAPRDISKTVHFRHKVTTGRQ